MTSRNARRPVVARLFGYSAFVTTLVGSLVGSLVGCYESTTAPSGGAEITPVTSVTRIACTADARARTVACSEPNAISNSRASGDLIVGGQHTFVRLSSSNVGYAGDIFSFDATVQNLIIQTLGTADGTTLDASGVRVFFDAPPAVLTGTGTIDFVDPATSTSTVDGYATFTGSNQPYYQYDELLATNQTSSAKRWKLHVPASVTTFSFTVYVSAPVQYPNGYVTLSSVITNPKPTQTRTLTAIVTDAVGRTDSGAPVAWSSDAPGVATVDASGVVTAVSSGTATITATSTTRAASRTITVVGSAWLGGTSDDFSDASNWSGSVVPTASDSILIPKLVPRTPRLTAAATVASVELEPGASMDLNGQDLTVSGNVNAGTVAAGGGITNGTLRFNGTATSTLVGTLPTTTILGDATSCGGALFTLNGATSAEGSITLNCPLSLGANALATAGSVTTTRSGTLAMGSSSSVVTVGGAMTFGGASESGLLTAGTLDVKGDLSQVDNGGVTDNFVGGTGFTVKLSGAAAQMVSIASPSASTFYDLNVTNASTGGVTLASIVDVTHNFAAAANSKVSGTFSGGGTRLIVRGTVTAASTANLGGLDSLMVTSNAFPSYANAAAHSAPRVTHLTGSNVTLTGNATIGGGLSIGAGGNLSIGAHTLTIRDSLVVDGDLDMASASSVVAVADTVRFRGGSSSTHILAGTLAVGGNFVESGSATTSFAAPSGFLVMLNGTSVSRSQEVRFAHPGSSASHFATVEIDNTTSQGVAFKSDVTLSGGLEQKGRLAISSPSVATVSGVANFRSGAVTAVAGTLGLAVANFYNGSSTTGAGTLTTGASTCFYGSSILGGDLNVGSFTLLTCTPGRINLP